MLTLCLTILSVHFGRILIGVVYRASPPLYMSTEQLSQVLQKESPRWPDRVKLFAHALFAS